MPSHHETGHMEEARAWRQLLVLRPTNAVAAHSVAHVFFETGDAANGGEFLETWLKGFDPRAPYHVHLSWHQALFALARVITSGRLPLRNGYPAGRDRQQCAGLKR